MSPVTYVIVDESSAPEIKGAAIVTMQSDIQNAYDTDFAPSHGVLPVEIFCRHATEVQPGDRVLHIVDSIEGDAPGALAYHTVDAQGNPVLRLGVNEHRGLGGNLLDLLSESLSHEIFETAKNPYVNDYSDHQGLVAGHPDVAKEVCDPVQGTPYRCGSTSIANFVLPAWFDAEDSDGPFDFVSSCKGEQILSKPFDCYASGYLAFRDGSQVFGDKMTDAHKAQAAFARVAHAHARIAAVPEHTSVP